MITSPSTESARRRSGLAAAIAAMLCISLAACSGASQQPAPVTHSTQPTATSAPATSAGTTGIGTGHPCALLTRSDVAGSIGEPVSAGVQSSAHGAGMCAYSSVTGRIAGGLVVVSSWSKLINAVHVAKLKQTLVSGIGDQASAVFSQTGAGYPALVVRKGAIGFEISIHGPNILALPDRGLAKEEALATLIVSRL